MVFDLIIRGGHVIDGTGLPRRRVDVGVKDGRIARIGRLEDAQASEEIDATGRIVAPGIVDAHTHYDPQITFDPYATMSCFHGVTTVLAGNCGFSVAPTRQADREFIQGIFAKVEDMDPIALSGVAWDNCESFGEFLTSLRTNLGINFACYVGHSNVRRWVMGEDAISRAATSDEIAAMRAIVAQAMAAGAAGFSTSLSPTQNDIQGRPVPSRFAASEEVLALAEEAGKSGAGSICFLPAGTSIGLQQEDYDTIIELGKVSGLPVIIQGLGARSKIDVPGAGWDDAVKQLDRAQAEGAPFYSLLIARPFDRPVAFNETNHHWQAVFSWHAMTRLPIAERRALLQDAAARAEMRYAVENQNRDPAKGTTLPAPQWDNVFVDASASLPEARHAGRSTTRVWRRAIMRSIWPLPTILPRNCAGAWPRPTGQRRWKNPRPIRALSSAPLMVARIWPRTIRPISAAISSPNGCANARSGRWRKVCASSPKFPPPSLAFTIAARCMSANGPIS